MEAKKVNKRTMTGVVVSDSMDKTVVVKVEVRQKHPLYSKIVRKSRRIKAHDEKNECKVGDTVRVTECRPLSKEKCWRLTGILERAK